MGTSWTELAFTALGRIDDGLASADASDPRISATGPVEGDTGVAILADVLQRVLTPRATADGDRRPRFRGPRLGDVTLPAVVEANCEWVSAVREAWLARTAGVRREGGPRRRGRAAIPGLSRRPSPSPKRWPHHHRAGPPQPFGLLMNWVEWPDERPGSRSTSFTFFFSICLFDHQLLAPTDQARLRDPDRALRAQSLDHSADLRASLRHPHTSIQAHAPALLPRTGGTLPAAHPDRLRALALHAG
jgi:hypothetical protein